MNDHPPPWFAPLCVTFVFGLVIVIAYLCLTEPT